MNKILIHTGWLLFALMVRLPLVGTVLFIWSLCIPEVNHAVKTSVLIVPSTLLIFVMLVCSISLILLEPKRGTAHVKPES